MLKKQQNRQKIKIKIRIFFHKKRKTNKNEQKVTKKCEKAECFVENDYLKKRNPSKRPF